MPSARPPAAERGRQFPALTGLRFLLAAWVLIHHLTGHGRMLDAAAAALPPAAAGIFRSGYLAVSSFFVLSGFVLARNYAVRRWTRKSLAAFGAARLARLLPVYVLSLLIVLPFIVADLLPPSQRGFSALASYLLLLQGWTGSFNYGWNTPAWSLSCEMFFYLCFPLLIVWLGNMGKRATLLVAVFACVLPPVLLRAGVPDMWKPLVHVADFLMGIVAARTCDWLFAPGSAFDRRGTWLYAPALVAGLALIGWPQFISGSIRLNDLLRPLSALLLIGLALGGGWLAALLSTRWLVYLGQASYALYILHIPLLWWFTKVRTRWLGHVPPAASGLLYVACAIALTAAVFRYFEVPANRYLRDRARRWYNPPAPQPAPEPPLVQVEG